MEKASVKIIYAPSKTELKLAKQAGFILSGQELDINKGPSCTQLECWLRSRKSPIKLLNFAFLIENVSASAIIRISQHMSTAPYLPNRNGRRKMEDGECYYLRMLLCCNADELLGMANHLLCMKVDEEVRTIVRSMCVEAVKQIPELDTYLVPNCVLHNGKCYEPDSCGRWY